MPKFRDWVASRTTGPLAADDELYIRDDSGDISQRTTIAALGAALATAGTVTSVNGATGAVTLDADDIDDAATAHKFTTADDISKLAGIEAAATADQTANEILTAVKTVDGTGSGLDADLLDGNEATAFATAAQGGLADSATQPGDLATVATSGAYSDLSGTPTLGNAAGLTVDADLATFALPASTTISAFGATLVDDADQATARTTLGLGTAATATIADYLPKVAGGASVENIGAVEENVQTVGATGATETLDTATYGVFDMTMDEACEFTFSNPAPSGKLSSFVLILRGAFTPTLPASVDWSGGAAPAYTTPSVYTFTTVDGGTVWLGSQVGAAFA